MTFDPTQNRATLSPEAVAQLVADREAGTPGPWFVAGVRVKMDRQQWLAISRYDEDRKRDENICCAGYDPKDGLGSVDARRIARLPDIEAAYLTLAAENATLRASEAAALERVKVLEEALMIYADSCDETETKSCGYDGNMCCRSARAALTPTADKEPTT